MGAIPQVGVRKPLGPGEENWEEAYGGPWGAAYVGENSRGQGRGLTRQWWALERIQPLGGRVSLSLTLVHGQSRPGLAFASDAGGAAITPHPMDLRGRGLA